MTNNRDGHYGEVEVPKLVKTAAAFSLVCPIGQPFVVLLDNTHAAVTCRRDSFTHGSATHTHTHCELLQRRGAQVPEKLVPVQEPPRATQG